MWIVSDGSRDSAGEHNEVIGGRDDVCNVSSIGAAEPAERVRAGDDAVLGGEGDICGGGTGGG